MEDKSLAQTLVDNLTKESKRKDIIIIILIGALLLTTGGFIWYINQFDYSEEYTNTTDSGGNACIGDNCINGNSVQKDENTQE